MKRRKRRGVDLHTFLMTIAYNWYDPDAEFAREFEGHFRTSRAGSIRTTRRTLARRGVPMIQREIYRRHHIWVPKRRLRVSFEREEAATASQRIIEVLSRSMRYRGKHWSATPLPSKVISYAKRRRRRAK